MHAQVKVSSSERFVLDEVDVPYQEAGKRGETGKGTWCATNIHFPYCISSESSHVVVKFSIVPVPLCALGAI